MIARVQTASNKERSQVPSSSGATGLDLRLHSLGLTQALMEGDGACQFRSLADQILGSQTHHGLVRAAVVRHIRAHADFFGLFFDSPHELQKYIQNMACPRTWGDELTLRAAVEVYQCVAHVITSEAANWYLVYRPDAEMFGASLTPPTPSVESGKEIIIAYVSPIHYNAVRVTRRRV